MERRKNEFELLADQYWDDLSLKKKMLCSKIKKKSTYKIFILYRYFRLHVTFIIIKTWRDEVYLQFRKVSKVYFRFYRDVMLTRHKKAWWIIRSLKQLQNFLLYPISFDKRQTFARNTFYHLKKSKKSTNEWNIASPRSPNSCKFLFSIISIRRRPARKTKQNKKKKKVKEKWQKEGQMVPVEEWSRLTPIERDATHDKRSVKARGNGTGCARATKRATVNTGGWFACRRAS